MPEAVFEDALEEFASFEGTTRLDASLEAFFKSHLMPLFQPLSDGWAEDFVLREIDHVGFESPFDFVFHSCSAAENDECGGGLFLLLAGQGADLFEDEADDLFRISFGEQSPFVVGPVVAGEQIGTVHSAEVNYGVLVAGGGGCEELLDGEGGAAGVQKESKAFPAPRIVGSRDRQAQRGVKGELRKFSTGEFDRLSTYPFSLNTSPSLATVTSKDRAMGTLRPRSLNVNGAGYAKLSAWE